MMHRLSGDLEDLFLLFYRFGSDSTLFKSYNQLKRSLCMMSFIGVF